MPIFQLSDRFLFPDPHLAEDNGLLAIGGDLKPERLLLAYSLGIFPWFSEGDPILWWFTSPRLVLFLEEFHIPKRLARLAKNTSTRITMDTAFTEVMRACRTTRTQKGEQTWISPEMITAYSYLYRMGYAHSIECWQDDQLVGGLYGVSLGRIFFGESMFSKTKSTSQFALIALVEYLNSQDFKLIDCQMTTKHLLRFGAREISGKHFQEALNNNIKKITLNDNRKNRSHFRQ